MHICMIMSNYQETSVKTGADLQADLQIRALQAMGHTITIIAKKHSWASKYFERLNDCDVYRVGPPGLRSLLTCLILLRNRAKFEIIHIHGQHTNSVIAIGLAKLLGIPTLLKITIAGRVFARAGLDKLFPRKLKLIRRTINFLSSKASAYLVISNEIAEELPRAGFFEDRIVRIQNGVDMTRFHSVTDDIKQKLRKQLGLPIDKKIVLYSSRLTYRKGYDLFLKAWPQILSQYPNAHLVVVGGGDTKAEKELAKFIEKIGNNNISCIGQVEDTAPYLQCADIYMFLSRKEGLPNALIEALACGCACVASDIGGCSDLIIQDRTGLLFDNGNPNALTAEVLKLLSSDEKSQQLGNEAHNFIKENYEINQVAHSIHNLYTSVKLSQRI